MKELLKGAEGPLPLQIRKWRNMTEVGGGIIDWKHIFANSSSGIEHHFVEHDFPAEPFVSITKSYAYLSKLTL
jgi:hypothetical protein